MARRAPEASCTRLLGQRAESFDDRIIRVANALAASEATIFLSSATSDRIRRRSAGSAADDSEGDSSSSAISGFRSRRLAIAGSSAAAAWQRSRLEATEPAAPSASFCFLLPPSAPQLVRAKRPPWLERLMSDRSGGRRRIACRYWSSFTR